MNIGGDLIEGPIRRRIERRAMGVPDRLRSNLLGAIEHAGYTARYRLADLRYRFDVATPTRTVAGRYLSYEPTNAHGNDPGLAVLSELPNDATIFDVGGHAGEYAVPLAIGTDRRIVSFEPNGRSAERLRRTIERNGVEDRVDVRRLGIGAVDEERPFYRSTYSKLSSFDREAATRWGSAVEAVESVTIRRLDSIDDDVPPPDGLKIDVEGQELDALEGGAATIETHRPTVVVEVHEGVDWGEISAWFTERGYAVEPRGDAVICLPCADAKS